MYLYEIESSVLTNIKSKYQSTLENAKDVLHPAVLNIQTRFDSLRQDKQAYHLISM